MCNSNHVPTVAGEGKTYLNGKEYDLSEFYASPFVEAADSDNVAPVVAAAVTQYVILGRGVWSPGTLALLGGATGLAMALMESFALLKTVTLLNVAAWVSYYIAVGSYTNLIGNAFVLVGVIASIWQRARRTAEPPTITASGLTVPVDTGSLRRVLHSEQ